MPTALVAILVLGLVPLFVSARVAEAAGSAFPLHVMVGQSLVLEMRDEVTTVSIADAKIADAAVGSPKTVVVNGKVAGTTSLVVWEEGGDYTLYQVICADAGVRDQVLLKCKVAEVNQSKAKELGMDWTAFVNSAQHLNGSLAGGLFASKVETPADPPLLGPNTDGFVAYRQTDGNFRFLSTLQLLEESGAARVLASPNLVALSGDSASFLAGGEFPVPIAQSANANSFAFTIEWKQYGVKLQFLPTVLDSSRIRLLVKPEVSSPDYSRGVVLAGTVVPGLLTRRIETTVEMKGGEVLVIGGVKQTEEIKITRKVPILGDIPLINALFKHKSSERIDRDLVIVVSPEVVGQLARTWPSPLPGETGYDKPQTQQSGSSSSTQKGAK
jgi:pilus assembly protein CpaC